ncbi:MAG: nitroreductase [Acidobacteriota bacterium]|jgi:hypothetical protein
MKARSPWTIDERRFPAGGSMEEKARFLLQYAVLAPSSHNTQPWRFAVRGPTVRLYADAGRWLRVADPDRRELHISLGCALENLLIAAEHFGLGHSTELAPERAEPDLLATVHLEPEGEASACRPPELFGAITRRRTTRQVYREKEVSGEALGRLRAVCREDGVRLLLIDDPEARAWVERLIAETDERQFDDPAWRAELGECLGDGAFGDRWPVAQLSRMIVTRFDLGESVARRDTEAFASAPIFGVLISLEDDPATRVRIGQVFERVYLTATALGLCLQPVSQILELGAPKDVLGDVLQIGAAIPQQPFRLGYGKPRRRPSPRRPVEEVLVVS